MIVELRFHVSSDDYFSDVDYHIKRLLQYADQRRPVYYQLYSPGLKGKGKLKTSKGTGLKSLNQPQPACSLFKEES